MTNPESRTVRLDELALSVDACAAGAKEGEHDREIGEAEVPELSAYGYDSNAQTLVGIGPVERAERAERASRARRDAPPEPVPLPPVDLPESVRMPHSEPPGPFVASDEAELTPALPLKKGGPWAVALTAALVAAAAVAVVRGVVPRLDAHTTGSAAIDVPPATAGLAVNLDGASPHVLVDGQDRGTPPLRLTGLRPGEHVVSIVDPAYAPYSRTVTLVADRVSTLEPRLTFVRGALRLRAGDGAEGAQLAIIGDSERREVQQLPATLEMAPGEYRVRATRDGYAPFETSVVLSAASPSADVSVTLTPAPAPVVAGPSAHGKALEPAPAASPRRASGANATQGSLEITSSPTTNVVLDGRPIGKAPRVVPVAPGLHTVVFIHPERGRMLLNVNVQPGQTTSAAADF